MNGNAELLNYVYQNSEMGVETIGHLNEIAEDNEFKEQLKSQFKEYKKINQTAKELLNENNFDEKEISSFAKVRTYLMINMQTLTNKTSSHIAEMLIVGSTMGVIEAIKKIKEYSNAEKKILSLMKDLLKFEEDNINTLKQYL